jgi:hypothetical protein
VDDADVDVDVTAALVVDADEPPPSPKSRTSVEQPDVEATGRNIIGATSNQRWNP